MLFQMIHKHFHLNLCDLFWHFSRSFHSYFLYLTELCSKSSRAKNKSIGKREIYLDLSKWFPLIGTYSFFIAEWNYLVSNKFERKVRQNGITLWTLNLKEKLQSLPVFRSLNPTTILKKIDIVVLLHNLNVFKTLPNTCDGVLKRQKR